MYVPSPYDFHGRNVAATRGHRGLGTGLIKAPSIERVKPSERPLKLDSSRPSLNE